MTKYKKMKRKIPIFSITALPGIDYSHLTEIPEVKEAIIEETLCAIKDGINKKKKNITLFEIAGSNCYIELEKNQWKNTLENVLQFYLENEDYNNCAECRDLINKL